MWELINKLINIQAVTALKTKKKKKQLKLYLMNKGESAKEGKEMTEVVKAK